MGVSETRETMRKLILAIAIAALSLTGHTRTTGLTQVDTCRTQTPIEFTWGADIGSSIDLSAHDMSSIDFGAAVGMRRGWIRFLGAGIGANVMVSNSCRSYPIYAIFRPQYPRLSRLVFLDTRLGAVLNYLPDNVSQTDLYGSLCVGINLATGRKFTSYILVGYSYVGRRDVSAEAGDIHYDPLHIATIRLGIAF